MTHGQIIMTILADGQWHNIIDIMDKGFPGKINVAIRSRIAGLKKQGKNIVSRIGKNRQAEYLYIPWCEQPNLADFERSLKWNE